MSGTVPARARARESADRRVVGCSLYTSTLKKSEQAEQVLREIVESVPVPV